MKKKLLKSLETEVYLYALTHNYKTAKQFISGVFCHLRNNLNLIENEDYKKLYNECLILLKWLCNKELKCKNTPDEIHEIIADIMLKHHNVQFNKETVELYLKFRIDAWNTGYYDKLFI